MLEAIDAVLPSIEIVEHRFEDFAAAGTPTLIADDFFSVGCVLGKPVAPASLPDLAMLEGGFSINGAPPELSGSGSSILGHPLNALAWLATHCEAHGSPLAAGEVVTLGSVVKTIYPASGDHVVARFAQLGQASVELTV